MPPKKKTANKTTKKTASKRTNDNKKEPKLKKIKLEDIDEKVPVAKSTKDIINELKTCKSLKKIHKVDANCHVFNAQVVDDYDCMLNQTNIGFNNNKFYVIQAILSGGTYSLWTRWGRVGEIGANSLQSFGKDKTAATNAFQKKFKEKTKNDWINRENFQGISGKYVLMELEDDDDGGNNEITVTKTETKSILNKNMQSTLDIESQKLINLIFDNNMFQEELKNMNIDIHKMPLGKISKSQIAKGFEILDKIEMAIKNKKTSALTDLSSEFYTLVPHNFGRQRPPVINDDATLHLKMDLLATLGDIEIAQCLQNISKTKDEVKIHPIDANYATLDADLQLVHPTSDVGKKLHEYFNKTKSGKMKILNIWSVNRHSEGSRFAANKSLENRKLLWHGTKLAVVAAILKNGLRIMPHSGGLVGKGIYFASENSKSAGYTSRNKESIGIMFLNEVVLGKEFTTHQCQGSFKAPPSGHNSVVARGQLEPDPKQDTELVLEGKKVIVPQGKPVVQSEHSKSSFYQSEYLIYKEDQCRIRFILTIKF